jgi:hypothetical protein
MATPIFSITNHHVPGKHQPPSITESSGGTYRSYFENGGGDQSIFVYDRATGKGVIYAGDYDWAPDEVVNSQPQTLALNSAERAWLAACWEAATQ